MRSSPNFLVIALALCATVAFIAGACSDDEPDIQPPTGGAGGEGGVSNNVGGIGLAPAGGNGGMGMGPMGGYAAAPPPVHSNVYGGTDAQNDAVFPADIAVMSNGDVVVVGAFEGTVSFGGAALTSAGATDMFVAKYDADGQHVWSIRGGNAEDQAATSVAVDAADNIWIGGTMRGTLVVSAGGGTLDAAGNQFPDTFIAKLASDSSHIFSENHGVDIDGSDFGRDIATSPGNDAIFTGQFQYDASFGGMPLTSPGDNGSIFLVRYNNAGSPSVTLADVFGGTGAEDANAVAVGADASIAIGGFTDGDIDFGGGVLDHTSGEEAVLGVLSAGGSEVYSKIFPSDGNAAAVTALGFVDNGDLLVTGYFSQTIDLGDGPLDAMGAAKEIFIARFDNNGTLLFGQRYGSTGIDWPLGLAVDSQGFATVVGRFNATFEVNSETSLEYGAMANDAFIIRVAPDGHGYWGYNLGAVQSAEATSVAIRDDFIHVVGKFSGDINMGDGVKGGSITQGMFLAKYPLE